MPDLKTPILDASPGATSAGPSRWYWLPIGIFFAYTAFNMLDRQLLAVLAPVLRKEFHLSNAQYGALGSVFYAVSTIASPFAGLLVDRVGLNLGASLAILIWSMAGAATGFTHSLRGLMACRFGLGLGESGGGAAPGSILSSYMDPGQIGIGGAVLGIGTSLGAISAPLIVAALAPRYGWRSVFVLCGVVGLLWVPVWALTAKFVPPRFHADRQAHVPLHDLLRDRRLWGIIAAYSLARQTLWVNWTTLYFVQARGLTMIEANRRFVWYPSVFGAAGAILVGALAMHWVRRGHSGINARLRACWAVAPLLLITAAIPYISSVQLAAVAVGISFFASMGVWSCVHIIPIDLYGVGRAAFTYSLLECAFTGLQVVVSPAIGAMLDRYGFTPVCIFLPLLPIAGLAALRFCLSGEIHDRPQNQPA